MRMTSWSAATIVLYAAIGGPYLVLQAIFARGPHPWDGPREAPAGAPGDDPAPSVDVVIPVFDEHPPTLRACLESIANQDYGGPMSVYVVDDGSANPESLGADCFGPEAAFRLIRLERNGGKRMAQAEALRASHGDLVLNVDSDTVVAPDAVRVLVEAMADPGVGAAMGEVLAANAGATWLTRLIHLRYWFACNQEHAAQSRFGAVLCCCGPFAVYRRSVFERVLDDYAGQSPGGRPPSPGEDRHLTRLVLREGLQTRYAPDARALTVVPERILPFLRQQLRWNRSIYREMTHLAPTLRRLHPYLALDVLAQTVNPILLGFSVLCAAISTIATGAPPAPWYLATVALLGLLHCGYGVWRTRDLRFIVFLLYGFVHVGLTLSVRWYALCTLRNSRWGARAGQSPAANRTGSDCYHDPAGAGDFQ